MRNIAVLFSIILMSLSALLAQPKFDETRFEEVDAQISNVGKNAIFHPQLIVSTLIEGLTNDYDRVRILYAWIANNVEYDLFAFYHDRYDGQSVNEVLRSGKALCAGYSLLFKFFCDQANIESIVIDGYAKGFGYEKGQKFERANHSWNAVNIYGYWYLLDVTWAAGNPTNLSKHQKKIDLNTYFLTEPEIFIKTHIPEDPTWQLLDKKLSLAEFESSKFNFTTAWATNNYQPEDYEGLDNYDKEILTYQRASEFNPKNELFDALLAFAYLYKGISITDGIWNMNFRQLADTANFLRDKFYACMDTTAFISEEIDYSKIPYSKEIFIDEINYQKGVFNYEIGAELFLKRQKENIPQRSLTISPDKFFSTAKQHFNNVNSSSIYLRDAKEYLQFIKEFEKRAIEKIVSN